MVETFIGKQEEAMRPMLLESLRRDLKDLNIVIKLTESPSTSHSFTEYDGVDESVIELILSHCPYATSAQALEAMKVNNKDIVLAINMLHQTAMDED